MIFCLGSLNINHPLKQNEKFWSGLNHFNVRNMLFQSEDVFFFVLVGLLFLLTLRSDVEKSMEILCVSLVKSNLSEKKVTSSKILEHNASRISCSAHHYGGTKMIPFLQQIILIYSLYIQIFSYPVIYYFTDGFILGGYKISVDSCFLIIRTHIIV